MYFYSGPLKSQEVIVKNLENNTNKTNKNNNSDQEMLEDLIETNNKKNVEPEVQNNTKINLTDEFKNNIKEKKIILNNDEINKKKNSKKNKEDEIKNLTKEIEYIATNKNGDIFKILAKYGKTNIENSNILDLEKVDGIISSTERSQIYITADYAKYNYDNQNSQFYSNVKIKYDNKIITCDNLDLKNNENYAIAYNNVEVKDEKSLMKAQMITLNILTKDININSQEKIKIFTN